MGKIWSIAQESGKDWKSEKLQKYLSGNIFAIFFNSSGACFVASAISYTSRATDQKSRSTCARVRKSIRPRLNKFKASSRHCKASCQVSNKRGWLRFSHKSYSSFTSSWASSAKSSFSSKAGRLVLAKASKTNTEWWAVKERPDSVMIFGCGNSFFSQASTIEETASLTYSWIE